MTLAELALRQEDRFVVWPARTFLPTRRTFLRRIEMLRHSKSSTGSLPRAARLLAVGLLIACGLVVAGLRGPSGDRTAMAEDTPTSEDVHFSDADKTGFDLSQVPTDAIALVAVRPRDIVQRAEFKDLVTFLNGEAEFPKRVGVLIEDIEQVTFVVSAPTEADRRSDIEVVPSGFVAMIRVFDPADMEKLVKAAKLESKRRREGLADDAHNPARQQTPDYVRLDDRTIALGSASAMRRFLAGPKGRTPRITESPLWKQVESDSIVVAVDITRAREMIPARDRRSVEPSSAAFSPLWEEPSTAVLGVRVDEQLQVRAAAAFGSQEGAKRWQETLLAAKVLAQNTLDQARARSKAEPGRERPKQDAGHARFVSTAEGFFGSLRIRREDSTVSVRAKARLDGVMILLDSIRAARAAAQGAVSKNNLKQIGLLMHHYHSAQGCFPPAASHDADGKPLLSWRVHVLPFLGWQTLYEQFHLDEPWDSPHNIKLLPRMPSSFRHPAAKNPGEYHSSYYVLTGPDTVFHGEKGTEMIKIRDGTSKTILAVEADRPVPWTKPQDIPYDAAKPLPKLGGFSKGGFNAIFCDGSVHFIRDDIAERTLRFLIDKDDGKSVDPEVVR